MIETSGVRAEEKAGKRLALKRPLGRAVLLAFLLAVLLVAAGELSLRTAFLTRILPLPSYGIGHQNMDVKFAHLAALLSGEGAPTCILLGSSVVDTDIDPERFGAAFLDEADRRLDCYNFGIGGLVLPSADKIARVIRSLGGDGLLVVGVTPLDFEERYVRIPWQRSQSQIDASVWLRYRLGEFSFSGWLTDRSIVYRHFLRFRQWMESPRLSLEAGVKERSSRRGFSNLRRFTEFRHSEKKVERIRKKLDGFEVSAGRLELLGRIASGWGEEQTVFAEMPLHPSLHDVFPGGEEGYAEPLALAAASLEKSPARILRLDEDTDFSRRGLWRDYFHLNSMGAMIYSDWLAGRVAAEPPGRD